MVVVVAMVAMVAVVVMKLEIVDDGLRVLALLRWRWFFQCCGAVASVVGVGTVRGVGIVEVFSLKLIKHSTNLICMNIGCIPSMSCVFPLFIKVYKVQILFGPFPLLEVQAE